MDAAAGPLDLARHDLSRGRPDRALARLEGVAGAELEDREFWSLRAETFYELGRFKEAAEAAQAGLEREPEDVELLDLLALAWLEQGRKKQALKTIETAIALEPDLAGLHAHHGLILARSAKKSFRVASYTKARAAIDQAFRVDPTSEDAIRARAQVAMLSGDRRASEYAAEVLALDPEDEHAHVIKGAAHAERGQTSAALKHYDEAARLNPSDPELALLGRTSRVLQGRFAAPLLFAERLTRGHFTVVWIAVVLATFHADQPVLSLLVFAFWVYSWAVHFYIRTRARNA